MSLLFQMVYVLMWIGVVLSALLLLPYPRLLRKPIVNLLERIITNSWVKQIETVLISFVAFQFTSSYQSMKHYQSEVFRHKTEKAAAVEGVSQFELEKTINLSRLQLFLAQRNVYLCAFTLVCFVVVVTYLYSLKRDHDKYDELNKLKLKAKNSSGAVQQPSATSTTPTSK